MVTQTNTLPFKITPENLEQLKKDVEKERCKRDTQYFVDEYVFIEDRDKTDGIAIKFKLWEKQKGVLADFLTYRLVQILKARQLGLTWLALAYAVWCMIFRIGFSVIALSKTDDDAKELVRRIKFILENLPVWLLPKWEGTKETVTIFHKQPSTFQSFASSQNAGRSFTANLVLLDEWAFQQWAREIWKAAYPSINRPTGGQVIGLSTIERGTLFEDIWLNVKSNFHKIFLGWDTDPRRNDKWYEETKEELGDGALAEYPATIEEAFSIPGGAFFNKFQSRIHIRQPLESVPSWWNKYRGIDYGIDGFACYFVYIDNNGFARIYKEIHKEGLVISQAAYEVLKESGAKVPATVEEWDRLTEKEKREISRTQTEKIMATFAPPDLFAVDKTKTGKDLADTWSENGITLTKSKASLETRCASLSQWINPIEVKDPATGETYKTAMLTIDGGDDWNAAPNLVHSFLNIQKDKHNPKVYANQPHNLTHSIAGICSFATEIIWTPREPEKHEKDYDKIARPFVEEIEETGTYQF